MVGMVDSSAHRTMGQAFLDDALTS
jgi:hypothetical protein